MSHKSRFIARNSGAIRNEFHIETDREYAIARFIEAVRTLEKFPSQPAGKLLLVKPEDIFSEEDLCCPSSVERELEFLQSHTVHHYALIAFKLRAMNFFMPPDFGFALSTLRFWKQSSRKNNRVITNI